MSRYVSFFFLLATVILVGVFFFQIVQPFIFPLLLAAILALLFWPVHQQWITTLRGHNRIAALVTTFIILGVVILPVAAALMMAGRELVALGGNLIERVERRSESPLDRQLIQLREQLTEQEWEQFREQVLAGQRPTEAVPTPRSRSAFVSLQNMENNFSQEQIQEAIRKPTMGDIVGTRGRALLPALWESLEPYVPREYLDDISATVTSMLRRLAAEIYVRTGRIVADVVSFIVGFVIMALAIYFFLADGPRILRKFQALSPLEDQDEESLFREFDNVCRGVVLGTILAAVAQAVLLGIALAILGVGKIWLLALLTIVFAMIPFLGAAGVYLPVAGYLLLQGRVVAAIFLVLFGAGIISTSDNLIRAYVVHGTSHLHPLVALVSVLGGLQLVGLWGIFVGPIFAALFYVLLKIMNQKLHDLKVSEGPS